jgi:Ca-activated chloride channel family protein
MKTTVLLDHGPTGDGNWVVRAMLRLEGEQPTAETRVPLNLALVLDRSGSMNGDKLEAACDAACALVRRLAPTDVLSVVAYDDRIRTVVPARPVGAATDLLQQIRAIESGGSTNLSGGWLRGRELVNEGKADRTFDRVLLLTDGLANVGIVAHDQLSGLTARAREDGITTTTIGFGEDYDEVLLQQMAERGGGNSYYIESPDQAPSIFEHEIAGLLGVAAQNVTVSIKIESAQLIAVHHAYPCTTEGDQLRLDIGDLYAAEPKAVLVELLLDHPATDAEITLARMTVRGVVVASDGSIETRVIELPIKLSLSNGPHVEPEVQREALLLVAARAREEARAAHERGDNAAAAELLQRTAYTLREAGLNDDDVAEDASDLQAMAASYSVSEPSSRDLKYAYQRSQDALRGQRSKSDLISRQKRQPPKP